MRNPKAIWSVVLGVLALAVLFGGGAAAGMLESVHWQEAIAAIPVGAILAVLALRFGRLARWDHQRTLGRAGGRTLAATGRGLGALALLIAVTAGLAFVVFAVLLLVLG
jgi:choline-glycine betaine transporter